MKSISVKMTFLFVVAAVQCAVWAGPVPPGSAGIASTNPIGPRIEFASTVYDFGKAVAGEMVRHDFVFTNVGDALLEITGVYPSCGCTTAGTWSRTVEPGKTGIIPLEFNSARFSGAVGKTVSVSSNDKNQSQVVLQIKGTVWKPIEVSPQMAVLNVVSDSPSNPPATVSIVSSLDQPITLSDPVSSHSAFAAELKTIRAGKEFHLIISAVPPLTQGNVQGTITLKTSATNVPTITVTALAIVQDAFVINPRQIALPPGPLSAAFPVAVSIRHNGSVPLTLSEPAVNAEGVTLETKEVTAGHQFNLALTFPAGFQAPQGKQVEVTVNTSDPKHPVIKVPVYQGVRTGPQNIGLPGLYRGPESPRPPPPAPAEAP